MMPLPVHFNLAVLGPTETRRDGQPVDVRGKLARALLARLAAARGKPVPMERMIADLWHGIRPAEPAEAVHSFVYAARRAAEPGRRPRSAATVLVSGADGYALALPDEAVDAWWFDATVREATQRLAADEAAPAASLLRSALALWRGPAYAEFTDHPWAAREAARLETLRYLAVECLAEAESREPAR